MTNSAGLSPNGIPGYEGGPLAHLAELLDEPLFWLGHLASCAHDEEVQELLLDADYDAAEDFHRRLVERPDWPTFTIPSTLGRLYIVYRNLVGDIGTDYLLQHPDRTHAHLLATDNVHSPGPGLTWPELTTIADNGPPGGSTTDPDSRLLLLLPAMRDTAIPPTATPRLAAALRTHTAAEHPERLATALLHPRDLTQ
ncbi:hypothetical protein [Kitasatospora griseola]|uniref:hypothetical protein n=1 Tax=Kitasatospora griseola TaxID=2064 RepID=UPI00365729BC